MNNQELFDIALTNLRRQRVCSIRAGLCCYRGSNGARCAIGWAIPDELYQPEMDDGMDASNLMDHPEYGRPFQEVSYQLALEVQRAHDYYMPLADDQPEPLNPEHWARMAMKVGRGMEMWEAEMKEIAARFNLNYTVPA
jgi:hypothetical protein